MEVDDISRDQHCYRQFLFSSVTQNSSRSGNLLLNLLHRMSSLEFHEEVEQYAEQNDGDDDRPAHRVTQSDGYAAGNKKNDDEGIGKETENIE